jgi:hypothetical protein
MPGHTAYFRYWGEIGLNADIGIRAGFDSIRTSVVTRRHMSHRSPLPEMLGFANTILVSVGRT